MEFEWDNAKAALNLRKHGIAFGDAIHVFFDRNRLDHYDNRKDYGEDRWICIGQVYGMILHVAYTLRDQDVIRIISARKALTYEQKRYYEAQN